MHELYELKDKLSEQLMEYSKRDLSSSNLEVIDKLAHSIKNLDKIIECYEDDEYSMRGSYDGNMMDGRTRSYRGVNQYGSYARGRGRNARRDAMGRYSRDGGMVEDLRELMEDAPDERTRMEFERFIKKIEQM